MIGNDVDEFTGLIKQSRILAAKSTRLLHALTLTRAARCGKIRQVNSLAVGELVIGGLRILIDRVSLLHSISAAGGQPRRR